MKILVTGAGGFLGVGIVRELCNLGHTVVATDLDLSSVDDRAIKYECDLFGVEDPWNFFGKPDVLLHLCWRNGFVHKHLSHIEDLPRHYLFLLEMAKSVKRIAALGSMHEVGFHEGIVDESTPTNPLSLYGIAKNSLRQALDLLCKENNIKYQWLRGFYIYQNSSRGCSIFSKLYQAASDGKTLFPFTSGTNQYDFLDYDTFARYVAHAVSQDDICGIINICSGNPVSLKDEIEKFIKINKLNIKLDYGKYPDRPYDSKIIYGDATKIKQIMKKS